MDKFRRLARKAFTLMFQALWVALIALGSAPQAQAFPELTRHGYANCTACHVSPNGGGVLTQYGRELSREILSSWGTEREAQFLEGAFKSPEWLNAGGDIRVAQTFVDTSLVNLAQFFYMQADLELSATVGKLTADVSLGLDSVNGKDFPSEFLSRRHYLSYRFTDEFGLRVGRFYPAYGINTPDHYIPIKRDLGFDSSQRTESYNVEASWLGDQWTIYATGVFGRPDKAALTREVGDAISASYFINEKFRVGLSQYYGTTDAGHRSLFGAFGILGFTHEFSLLTEIDMQKSTSVAIPNVPSPVSVSDLAVYNKLGYEFVKGLNGFVTYEVWSPDFTAAPTGKSTAQFTYSVGAQWFPRPHFEFEAQYQKTQYRNPLGEYSDYIVLMGHYYL